MPETFVMLDRIAERLDAAPIDRLVIDDQFNAWVTEYRGERILGMGALLWEVMTHEERTSTFAHEIGHLVNGDPLRRGLVAKAHQVLQRWMYLMEPDEFGGENFAAEIIQVPATLILELIDEALVRLTYVQSQRAEYLADALEAEVVGPDVAVAALRTLALSPLVEEHIGRYFGERTPDGLDLMRDIGRAFREAPEDKRAALLAKMESEDHAIDSSHPPTIFRIRFLEDAVTRQSESDLGDLNWMKIEEEWTPHLERTGRALRGAIVVQ